MTALFLCALAFGTFTLDVGASGPLRGFAQDFDAGPDGPCLLKHCAKEMLACPLDTMCRKALICMGRCAVDDHLCQSRCFFAWSDPTFMYVVDCGKKYGCLPDMSWGKYKCPDPSKLVNHRIPHFNVSTFAKAGHYYVAMGSDPVYDCFDCQYLTFEQQAEGVKTHWTTDINGEVRGATYVLRQESPNVLVTNYNLLGMIVEEHYYIIDATDHANEVLYFYCGFGSGGEYQGAVVYSKTPGPLAPEVYQRFKAALEKMDLQPWVVNFSDFCQPRYLPGVCHNLAKHAETLA